MLSVMNRTDERGDMVILDQSNLRPLAPASLQSVMPMHLTTQPLEGIVMASGQQARNCGGIRPASGQHQARQMLD